MTKEEIATERAYLADELSRTISPRKEMMFSRCIRALYELEAANERLARVDAVWEQWRHMDSVWTSDNARYTQPAVYDLWQAVRKGEP